MRSKVLVSNVSGRMGNLLINEVINSGFLQLTGALVSKENKLLNKKLTKKTSCDILTDVMNCLTYVI